MSRLIPKKQKGNPIWAQPANIYFPQGEQTYYGGLLHDVDITAKPMSKARKAVRKALNMPIMVPAAAPSATSTATWQYNPSNLVLTTPKEELNYLAGMAAPFFPLTSSGYFLTNGIEDISENRANIGNVAQVGLSALPFAKPISKYAPIVIDKGLSAIGNKNAIIRNIGREFEKSINNTALKIPANSWVAEGENFITKIGDLEVAPNAYYSQGYNTGEDFLLHPTNNRWFSQGNLFYGEGEGDIIKTLKSDALHLEPNNHYKQNDPLRNIDVELYRYDPNYGYRKMNQDAIWDDAYFSALQKNNVNEAQRLRNLHFVTKAPNSQIVDLNGNPVVFWHGSPYEFTYFDPTKAKTASKASFFTIDKQYADTYGKSKPYYLNILKLDESNSTLPEFGNSKYDGTSYFINNSEAIAVNNPNNIKSASAITYDDFRNIIPLSKRDNFNINDIRYSIIPTIGLGAYGISKKKYGGNLIPKAQLGLKEQRIAENQRHSTLAKHYVLHPTLPNLAKAGYHWFKSKPGLGGQPENDYIYQTGVAPNPAMKPIGVSKTIKDGINSATKLENGATYRIKGLTKKGLLDNLQLMEARKFPHFEKPFNKQAYIIMETDDPSKIKAGLEKIQQLYDLFKKGLLK